MSDLLRALPPAATAAVEVVLVEPIASLRAIQQEKLATWADRTSWRPTLAPAHAPGMPVVVICNELLDAFPVDRVRIEDGKWRACRVVVDDTGGFRIVTGPMDDAWSGLLPATTGLPDGYVTEICPLLGGWTMDLAAAVPDGLVLVVDYGFEAEDYFHPTRVDGTLRTYRAHHALDDPFVAIGMSDITAHVNWSHLRTHLESAGFGVTGPLDQGRWLTRVGRDWLLAQEANPDPAWPKHLRQFQTLTHPQHMGGKFQVVEARPCIGADPREK